MAVRTTMQYLIEEVRLLIGDTAATESYTDQQIQDKLDLNRKDVYDAELQAGDQLMPDGTFEWHDFYAVYPFWETDVVIQKADGEVVTPTTTEPLIGRWTFTTDQEVPELYARGRIYDVYGVSSKLLLQLQNELRGMFNFTADGMNVQRIAQIKDLQLLSDKYASMGWSTLKQIKLVRRDVRH